MRLVRESGVSLLAIVNDILDLSKIDAGRMQIASERFRLRAAAVEQVTELLSGTAHEKELELTCEVSDALPETVVGDPVRFRQVLTNFVGNAIKFTLQGEVTVRVTVDAARADAIAVRVTVQDTGIGIPEDQVGLLFEQFSQIETSHARRFGGTGLGLAISRRIVERMGGAIGVESAPGQGSTFSFTMTFGRVAQEFEGADESQAACSVRSFTALARARPVVEPSAAILVADDNPVNQEVALETLRALGYEVDLAATGKEVLAALEARSYATILMDCQMPEMSGYEVTAELRKIEGKSARRTPVIALTASALEGTRERALAAGMDDYLSKPLERDALAAVLGRWVRRRSSSEAPAVTAAPPTLDPSVRRSPRVKAIFLEDLPGRLAKLRAAVGRGVAEEVAEAAHALKGSALAVGASRLAAACKDIEERRDETAEETLARIESAAEAVRRDLSAELAGASSSTATGGK